MPETCPVIPEEWEEQMFEEKTLPEDCSLTPEEWKEKMLEKMVDYPDQFKCTLGDAESDVKNFNI